MDNHPILAIDLGSSKTIAIIAQKDFNNKINIQGVGVETTNGVAKGNIVDIKLASKSIQNALKSAQSSQQKIKYKRIVSSVSSAFTKGVNSNGSVNIPNGHISQNEINQALQMALYNANIVPEYEVLQVLPIYFKVDDENRVLNPINIHGNRLEVSVYITTIKKTILTNLRNTYKMAGIEIDDFVLSSYLSALSLINQDREKSGFCVIDIGDTTTDIVVYKDGSILFSDFLPIGSSHITKDISKMINTPYVAAEKIKLEFGNLLPNKDNKIKKVKTPITGANNDMQEISIETIIQIIHARAEETLTLSYQKIKKSNTFKNIDAGVVLTGGMSLLPGIKELAIEIFKDISVTIGTPSNIENGYKNFSDPKMATIVGLLNYIFIQSDTYKLDSNKNFISIEHEKYLINEDKTITSEDDISNVTTTAQNEENLRDVVSMPLDIQDKKTKKGLFHKFMELF